MQYVAYEERQGACVLKIIPDEDAWDPRKDCSPFGTMVCWHDRVNLGDRQLNRHNGEIDEFVKELFKIEKAGGIVMPLWLYDHSGMTIAAGSSNPFHCPWDSGQVGFVYATAEDIRKGFMVKRITKKVREKAKDLLLLETKTYDQYLRGDVYGYVIEDEYENEIESCWGCYGYDYALEEGRIALREALGDSDE